MGKGEPAFSFHIMIIKGGSTSEPISGMLEWLQAVCCALAGDDVVKIKWCR